MSAVEIWNLVHAYAGHYTIGFTLIGQEKAYSCGSGALARYGDVVGILTCAHALLELKKSDEFGIVCFPVREKHFQSWKIEVDKVDWEIIGGPPWSEQGPDLGFVRLPPSRFSELSAIASVADLDRQARKAKTGEPCFHKSFDVVAGVVDQWNGGTAIEKNKATTQINGLLNVCRSSPLTSNGKMDIFVLNPVPEDGFKLPETFKGTSGGGVWRFYFDKTLKMIERRLVGVAFWEDPDDKFLVSHGPEALYEVLLEKMKVRWN